MLDRGEGDAWVITFVGASEIHKKDHRKKRSIELKSLIKSKKLRTKIDCCVNTTLM
jgi:hypothetical protein